MTDELVAWAEERAYERAKAEYMKKLDKIKAEVRARLCDVVSDYTDGYRTAMQGVLVILDRYKESEVQNESID